jgi:beta-glucanase (GH16 family)
MVKLTDEIWRANFNDIHRHWNVRTEHAYKHNDEIQRYSEHDTISYRNNNNGICLKMHKHGGDIKSAKLDTKGKMSFKYGYYEAEVELDKCYTKGLWPAIWFVGDHGGHWPNCGEIDLLEYVAWNKDAVYGTLHGPGYSGGDALSSGGHKPNIELTKGKHIIAMSWEPGRIKWYLNGKKFYETSRDHLHNHRHGAHWVFDQSYYMIINLALGGNFGGAFHDSKNYIFSHLPEYNDFKINYITVSKTRSGHGEVIHH